MLILHEQVLAGGQVLISGFVAIAKSNIMQENGKEML
jgi:hypothetical protein